MIQTNVPYSKDKDTNGFEPSGFPNKVNCGNNIRNFIRLDSLRIEISAPVVNLTPEERKQLILLVENFIQNKVANPKVEIF